VIIIGTHLDKSIDQQMPDTIGLAFVLLYCSQILKIPKYI